MNSAILSGALTKAPERRDSGTGSVAHFTIKVPRENSAAGADYIRITVFGKMADTAERYLSEGRQAAVQGRIQTGSYTNREGRTVYTTDIIGNNVEFLPGGSGARMNSVKLIGRLARDSELSYTANTQTAKRTFSVAVDRPRKNGESAGADFIRCTIFGAAAEGPDAKALLKGKLVELEGRIQTGSYKNREGVTIYTTDVIADRFTVLDSDEARRQAAEQDFSGYEDNLPEAMQELPTAAPEDDFDGFYESSYADSFEDAEDDIPF